MKRERPSLTISALETCDFSQPESRILSKHWMRAASSCLSSTTAISPKTTPSSSPRCSCETPKKSSQRASKLPFQHLTTFHKSNSTSSQERLHLQTSRNRTSHHLQEFCHMTNPTLTTSLNKNLTSSQEAVKIIDTTTFPIATDFAAALVTIEPGAMRELYWRLTSDE